MLRQALGRLTHLKVLHVGNYLTDDFADIFDGLDFPQLQILGFQIYPVVSCSFSHQADQAFMEVCGQQSKPYSSCQSSPMNIQGDLVLHPPTNIARIAASCQNLQELHVRCKANAYDQPCTVILESSYMNQSVFPNSEVLPVSAGGPGLNCAICLTPAMLLSSLVHLAISVSVIRFRSCFAVCQQ